MVEPSGFGLLTSQQLFTKGSRINDPQTFDQQLDHFDSSNSATWKQRCIYNDTFFVSRSRSGPVFVVIDGEEALNLRWDISGHHIEMAEKFGALVVVIEHRFYGLSTPVDQLDLKSVKSNLQFDITKNRVITFGGSYAGSLSAWSRIKYPDVIYASVASSAPVFAKGNFFEYNQLLSESYASEKAGGSKECQSRIKESFFALSNALNTSDSSKIDSIYDQFKVCPSNRAYNELDKSRFVEIVAQFFQVTVQYNGQDGVSIQDLCGKMLSNSTNNALNQLSDVFNDVSPSFFGCSNSSFSDVINHFQNLDAHEFTFDRQWKFQTCNEFGYYQTCDFPNDSNDTCIFGPYLSFKYYSELCNQLFKISASDLETKVSATNKFYGSKNPQGSRILFVNGDIDPWRALSVTQDGANDITCILISGGSHFQNMFGSLPSDSDDMKKGREKIQAKVSSWISSSPEFETL